VRGRRRGRGVLNGDKDAVANNKQSERVSVRGGGSEGGRRRSKRPRHLKGRERKADK
jgi:hypothetical protein